MSTKGDLKCLRVSSDLTVTELIKYLMQFDGKTHINVDGTPEVYLHVFRNEKNNKIVSIDIDSDSLDEYYEFIGCENKDIVAEPKTINSKDESIMEENSMVVKNPGTNILTNIKNSIIGYIRSFDVSTKLDFDVSDPNNTVDLHVHLDPETRAKKIINPIYFTDTDGNKITKE